MMLTIETQGGRALLALLQSIRSGKAAGEAELEAVLVANAFFVDFYSGWQGCDREKIKQSIRDFDQPVVPAAGLLLNRLVEGFRQAADQLDLMQARLVWLEALDPAGLSGLILDYLPPGTPLDAVIHITVDDFNNAFVSQGEMGVSLLRGVADRQTFEEVVSHELHHVGFRYWSARDTLRQQLIAERSGRSVAVLHVENLLMEGLANYYCSPRYVFPTPPAEAFAEPRAELPADPYLARLARLRREEGDFFAQANAVLEASLEPEAAYEPCLVALQAIAMDMQEAMLPAGHYLGARMIQVMQATCSRERILACIQRLPDFLPAYNQAAGPAGAFVFDPRPVTEFARLWE
jgi:hypothetical protein